MSIEEPPPRTSDLGVTIGNVVLTLVALVTLAFGAFISMVVGAQAGSHRARDSSEAFVDAVASLAVRRVLRDRGRLHGVLLTAAGPRPE